jgi:hypothetical protein
LYSIATGAPWSIAESARPLGTQPVTAWPSDMHCSTCASTVPDDVVADPREALECPVDIERKELVCFDTVSQKGGLEIACVHEHCVQSGQKARGLSDNEDAGPGGVGARSMARRAHLPTNRARSCRMRREIDPS